MAAVERPTPEDIAEAAALETVGRDCALALLLSADVCSATEVVRALAAVLLRRWRRTEEEEIPFNKYGIATEMWVEMQLLLTPPVLHLVRGRSEIGAGDWIEIMLIELESQNFLMYRDSVVHKI